jgi:hypothetical protein
MKNITLSMDEELLKAGKKYAREHNTSLNALIRDLVKRTVCPDSSDWFAELKKKIAKAGGCSDGTPWNREDAYDV